MQKPLGSLRLLEAACRAFRPLPGQRVSPRGLQAAQEMAGEGPAGVHWFEVEDAAQQVLEPALAAIIRTLPLHVPQAPAPSDPVLVD